MGSVRTSIIGRPRPLPGPTRRTAPYTLICDEPRKPTAYRRTRAAVWEVRTDDIPSGLTHRTRWIIEAGRLATSGSTCARRQRYGEIWTAPKGWRPGTEGTLMPSIS